MFDMVKPPVAKKKSKKVRMFGAEEDNLESVDRKMFSTMQNTSLVNGDNIFGELIKTDEGLEDAFEHEEGNE